MLRVTADTNSLVSGLNFRGGKPFQLLELARSGKINLTVSESIMSEMEDVLRRKFEWTDEEVAEGRRRIRAIARTVQTAVRLDVIKEDPADDRILECAVTAGSDCIVTGDKDRLRLRRYDSVHILTASEFFDVMRGKEDKSEHGGPK